MDEVSKLREQMTVVSADGRIVGLVSAIEPSGIRVTGEEDGRGFVRVIPPTWVADVGKYAFLNKESGEVAKAPAGSAFELAVAEAMTLLPDRSVA